MPPAVTPTSETIVLSAQAPVGPTKPLNHDYVPSVLEKQQILARELLKIAGDKLPAALMVLDLDQLDHNVHEWRTLLPGVEIHHSLTEGENPLLLLKLHQHGVKFVAHSAYHVELLESLGVSRSEVRLAPVLVEPRLEEILKDGKPLPERVVKYPEELTSLEAHDLQRTVWLEASDTNTVRELFNAASAKGVTTFGLRFPLDVGSFNSEALEDSLDLLADQIDALYTSGNLSSLKIDLGDRFLNSFDTSLSKDSLPEYLKGINSSLHEFANFVKESHKIDLEFIASPSNYLFGDTSVFSAITGIIPARGTSPLRVMCEESVYGSLNQEMFEGKRIPTFMLPRFDGKTVGALVEATAGGGSCDAVDGVPYESKETIKVPNDITRRDHLQFCNPGTKAHKGMPFNMVPLATLVAVRRTTGGLEYEVSPTVQFEKALFKELKDWVHGPENLRIRSAVERTKDYPLSFFAHEDSVHLTVARQLHNDRNHQRHSTIGIDVGRVIASARALITAFGIAHDPTLFKFAVKACNDPLVVAALRHCGVGIDSASAREMLLALVLGFKPESIIVSHPRKTRDTIKTMIKYPPGGFTVDSKEELDRMVEAGFDPKKDKRFNVDCFVRVAFTAENVGTDLNKKFGCRADEVLDVMLYARSLGFASVQLASHPGTQNYTAANHHRLAKIYFQIFEQAQREGLTVSKFNFGGGFCDQATAISKRFDISHSSGMRVSERNTAQEVIEREIGREALKLKDRIAQRGITASTIIEPGRAVFDKASLYVRVERVERSADGSLKIFIAGSTRGEMSGKHHDGLSWDATVVRVDNAEKDPLSTSQAIHATLYGMTSEPFDFLKAPGNRPYIVPGNVKAGDYIILRDIGSYSNSAAARVSGIDPAPIVAYATPAKTGEPYEIFRSPWENQGAILLKVVNEWMAKKALLPAI